MSLVKTGIRTRLYGGFGILVALSAGIDGFAVHTTDALTGSYENRARRERVALKVYTINSETARLASQTAVPRRAGARRARRDAGHHGPDPRRERRTRRDRLHFRPARPATP